MPAALFIIPINYRNIGFQGTGSFGHSPEVAGVSRQMGMLYISPEESCVSENQAPLPFVYNSESEEEKWESHMLLL